MSTEVRGRLLPHGLSGVQVRHYDAYDYSKEKMEALTTLDKLLQNEAAAREATTTKAEVA